MTLPSTHLVYFTPEEKSLIQDTRFFETKTIVTQKVKTFLHQLQPALIQEVDLKSLLAPEGFDSKVFQYVKGEHLLDFPYLYLDFPKYFKKEEKFTFRTLFWWGHFFAFSWILEGLHLNQYKDNLLTHYDVLADRGLFILRTSTPWEWRKTSQYVIEIKKENQSEVKAVLKTSPFLKIHYYVPFDGPSLLTGALIQEAIEAFRLMCPVVLKSYGSFQGS